VTHTGRIPFGLASFVVKKRFLCKGDHCEDEETSSILRREVCVIYVIAGLQNRIESCQSSTCLLVTDSIDVLQLS
jgi:hypothetical protein